ncbi:hypothetical protein [Flexivirga oryzae]|uniref:DUF4386 family protein n=1 Tax=Flexivirga oryzae TaxID=1794944 RepID=A0A839NI13_9MICO|nr:hypothetical protein [Flexivirga oryzae]MBB2894052.1 hypothetical protein [Flexivirga oryzae]
MNETTRSRVAALLLVLGPVAFTLGDLLRRIVVPAGNPTAVSITQVVSDHQAIWLAAGLLNLLTGFLLVPGVLALIPASGTRGARATTIGAVLMAVGSVAAAAHSIAFFSPYALYGKASAPASAITAIDNASESYPLLIAVIAIFMIGMMLGSLVLLIGLRRARRVPIWSVVAVVVFIACGSTGGIVPGLLGVAAAVVAFVPAARSLLRPEATHQQLTAQEVPLAG